MKPKIDNNKGRSEPTFFVLIAVAVLSGALAFATGASFFRGSARMNVVLGQVVDANDQEPNDLQRALDEAREAADALKQSNLFIKQAPKEHPIKQIDGILGNEVLIGDRWYKAGDTVGDAEIVAVGSTEVRVRWDGQEKTFTPLAASGQDQQPGPPRPAMPKRRAGPPQEAKTVVAEPGPAPAEVKVVTVSAQGEGLDWMGVDLPPAARAKLLEEWNKMSDERKEQAKAKWNGMSADEKQQAVEMLSRRR